MRSAYFTILTAMFFAAGQQASALTLTDQTATFYYDMSAPAGDGGICVAAGQPATWNDPNLLPGTEPACAVVGAGESYTALNTNRIVAISADLVSSADRTLCGKEVKVFDKAGKQILLDEGPFFVYDGCAACTSMTIVDFSVNAIALMSGGTCGVEPPKYNPPTGLRIEITDNTIFHGLGSSGTGGTTPSSSSSKKVAVQSMSSASDVVSSADTAAPAKTAPTSSSNVSVAPVSSPTAISSAAVTPEDSSLGDTPAPVSAPAPAPFPAPAASSNTAPVSEEVEAPTYMGRHRKGGSNRARCEMGRK